jgi:hypothetical protein
LNGDLLRPWFVHVDKRHNRVGQQILMKESEVYGNRTSAAQEREAYAHDDYVELLRGLQEAVAIEEELRWGLVAAQARIDVWRSQEASARQEVKAVL